MIEDMIGDIIYMIGIRNIYGESPNRGTIRRLVKYDNLLRSMEIFRNVMYSMGISGS